MDLRVFEILRRLKARNEPIGFALSASDILYFTAETDTNNTAVSSLRFSLNVYENN